MQLVDNKENNEDDGSYVRDGMAVEDSSDNSVELVDADESDLYPYDLSRERDILKLLKDEGENKIAEEIIKHVWGILAGFGFSSECNCIFLMDLNQSMSRNHAEKIYTYISSFEQKDKNIVLFLNSRGGRVEPAYLISKICNKYKKSKFIVSIPSEAKSAATLLALGANEVHMGVMSELGPIDPQVDGLPLLSVPSSLDKIAKLVEQYPGSSSMFSSYLRDNLKIGIIGYYDRITESATQYAQRLIRANSKKNNKEIEMLASHFTNHYKDHRFVIDIDEAIELLGDDMVIPDTDIYKAGSYILSFLNTVESIDVLFLNKSRKISLIAEKCYIFDPEDLNLQVENS
ncbi:ATP-dependent Clp protease proteolytic subunit [Pectobacterium sp. CHL-2024]|uniref:SDH family Clp fold serine proteinase n=1 Tax=Pectobacterium sp. CHL-2024 TaxID=3377079 RepID=UPI00382DFE02